MTIAIIGCGGLGGPAARGLIAGGCPVALFDGDAVELHNLPRQTLFADADVGQPKASLLAERLRALAPSVQIQAFDVRLEQEAAERLAPYPVWVDATDSLASKLAFSDLALSMGRTLIHGGAVRLGGQALGIVPGRGPCLRCLVDAGSEGETCQSAGILGPVVALLGAEMARLALRAVAGADVAGQFVAYDAKAGTLRSGRLARRLDCEACRASPFSSGPVDGAFSSGPVDGTSDPRREELATVRIPASLRSFTKNQEEVQSPGGTVGEVIKNLEGPYPGLRARILDDQGALRRYVNVFQNEEDVRFLQGLETKVAEADRISIVPAIAGG